MTEDMPDQKEARAIRRLNRALAPLTLAGLACLTA